MVNLTPKEKAEDLVNKFLKQSLWMYQAKGCALIAVDEIMSIDKLANERLDYNFFDNEHNGFKSYWQEVKQEINNI